jgi:hypothetical protein
LGPWHRVSCPSADWSYTNYHSLNLFTASSVGSGTVLLYPNVPGGQAHEGYATGTYALSGAFTFDLSLNPRYRPEHAGDEYRAGTIFHMSSSYALSLVSGSARDENGLVSGFRLQLQLGRSADVPPSSAVSGLAPSDLVFLSDDNSLVHNAWHRCVVRWGTQDMNDGSGSFVVDGVVRGTFVVPSGTIMPVASSGTNGPALLAVGNFLESSNSGSSRHIDVFGPSNSSAFGVVQLSSVDAPGFGTLTHQLNAEAHDLSIWRRYRTDVELAETGSAAPSVLDDVAFYMPPFFRQHSPIRRSLGGAGGIMVSPLASYDGTTEDPANVLMALSCEGHSINVENFLHDLASDVDPLVPGVVLTGSLDVADASSAMDALYANPQCCARNLLIVPCDDGAWVPCFDLIGSCLTGSRHADAAGRSDPSLVSLVGTVSTSSLLFGSVPDEATGSQESLAASLLGVTPDDWQAQPGPALAARFVAINAAIDAGSYIPSMHRDVPTFGYQRSRDDSTAAVTMFDVSNLYYGTRILPGTLVLSDPALTGSSGRMGVTLRDDGFGGLFRADSSTAWATWNSVGTVFYEEGLVVVRSPHLALFGKDGFEVSFRGERKVHVMRIDAVAPANQLNSSSNPAYRALPPSNRANEPDAGFVYVTGINFHDENLNVVARTQLAQPIMKRFGDRIAFSVKLDW